MEDALNATQLRARLYRVLDEVISTGQPQRLVRKGHSLLITLESSPRRLDLDALPRRRATDLSPEELADLSWEDAWEPDR